MTLIRPIPRNNRRTPARLQIAVPAIVVVCMFAAPALGQRVFGVDTADVANATAPSQTAWNNAFNDADGDGVAYKFAVVRAAYGD